MNFDNIKDLRDELNLTQEEMAKKIGCSRSAYSLWEINKNTIPLYYLNKIANTFSINIDYLANLSSIKYLDFIHNEIDKQKLGKNIKLARKRSKLSQVELAKKLNTTHSVISAYENGITNIPTIFIIEIAKITKESLNYFLDKNIVNK